MKKRNILGLCILLLSMGTMYGQKSYFFGERYPQPENELPKSKAPFQEAVRVPKKNEPAVLDKVNENAYLLHTGWELAESKQVMSAQGSLYEPGYNTSEWYNATVPGTVLTTLVNQGVYPDPYWGLNNLTIPETLCRRDWWYRIAFEIPKGKTGKKIFLRLNGINYRAEIWLNYKLVGEMKGAFTAGEFEVTPYIHQNNKNVLAVRIFPPNNPGIPQEQNSISHGGNGGLLCLDGPTFISSEGWDWMPGIRDRNIGIWQDVQLLFREDISIKDMQVLTDLPLPDTKSAEISINVDVVNHSAEAKAADIQIRIENINISKRVALQPHETKTVSIHPAEYPQLKIKNPRLWWPNGYGTPELYTMTASLMQGTTLSDVETVRFGIREFEYELSVDKEGQTKRILFNPLKSYAGKEVVIDNLNKKEVESGIWVPSIKSNAINVPGIEELPDDASNPYLILRVNGQRIFCKGGNWGMDDAMKRVSRERLEPYVRFHKEQGFTMIRNWTAESTEKVFYDLCDEYGILVFNDFGLSTENHNLLPADYNLFLNNVNEIVTRFRNHPSIAIWCPQNEGFPPAYIENGISKIISGVDGTRHYLGNSRTLNSVKSGPWQYRQPTHYYEMAKGFASEVGSPSLPTAESLRKMMAEEDLWPIGDVWYYHDWLMGKWGEESLIQSYEDGINHQFGKSSNVDEFARKAQLINYESYRAIFEGWNSKLFDSASGILLWMSHPAWPSMVWQTYTWDYETPGAYYGAKKGCEPVHVQYNLLTKEVEVINTSLQSLSGLRVIAQHVSLDGKIIRKANSRVNVEPNQRVAAMPFGNETEKEDCYFIRLQLKNINKVISHNFYWMSDAAPRNFTPLNNIPEVSLTGDVVSRKENSMLKGTVKLKNNTDKVALALKLNVRNAETGEAVLPAYFDDGYFSLLPGEERTVGFECSLSERQPKLKLTVEGYNVQQQDISLIH